MDDGRMEAAEWAGGGGPTDEKYCRVQHERMGCGEGRYRGARWAGASGQQLHNKSTAGLIIIYLKV